MIPARQSTAFEVPIGPVLDADGVAVTGCVVADFKIKKTTGNFAALNGSATLTHVSAGTYDLVLTTSDLDTVGLNTIAIDDTVNACAPLHLQVMEEAIYDALYAPSANAFSGAAGSTKVSGVVLVDTLTTYTGNTPQTGDSFARIGANGAGLTAIDLPNQTMDITGNITGNLSGSVGSVTGSVGSVAAGGIAATSIADGAFTAAKFAAGAFDAVWTVASRTLTSFGTVVADVATAVWSAGTRILTAGTNIVLAKGTGVTGFNDPTAAENATAVRSELTTELGRIDVAVSTRLATAGYTAPPSAATIAAAVVAEGGLGADVDAVKLVTDRLSGMLQLDGAGPAYQFTEGALEQAPAGGGGGGGSAEDNWEYDLADVAAQDADTIGKFVYEKLNLLGSAEIEIIGPVATDGDSITLFVGGSYLAATGNALEWSLASPSLSGYTVNFGLGLPVGPTVITKTGTVVDAGLSTQKVRVELTAAETAALSGHENKAMIFTIVGVSGSTRLPLISGSCLVRRNYAA